MAAAAGRVPVVGMSAESREGRLELWDRLLAAPFAVLEAGRDPGAR
jgi:hypothetical protein